MPSKCIKTLTTSITRLNNSNTLEDQDPVKLFLNHPESSPKMVSETSATDKRKDNSSGEPPPAAALLASLTERLSEGLPLSQAIIEANNTPNSPTFVNAPGNELYQFRGLAEDATHDSMGGRCESPPLNSAPSILGDPLDNTTQMSLCQRSEQLQLQEQVRTLNNKGMLWGLGKPEATLSPEEPEVETEPMDNTLTNGRASPTLLAEPDVLLDHHNNTRQFVFSKFGSDVPQVAFIKATANGLKTEEQARPSVSDSDDKVNCKTLLEASALHSSESQHSLPPPPLPLLRHVKEPPLTQAFPARALGMELKILVQPEKQHRARYLTEGSRGAIKDDAQSGHPIVKLLGFRQPVVLQVFIGMDAGKVRPHGFYQACKVFGKNSTQCSERDMDGTVVIEIQLDPEVDMTASIDCVGILKLRNADVEQRIGVTSSKKKSTKARLVFRTAVPKADGSLQTLQVASSIISCTQPAGLPEICKQSLTSSPVTGGQDLFVIGKNFMRGTKVYFEERKDDQVAWTQEAVIDNEHFSNGHLICTVPAYRDQAVTEDVEVQISIHSSGRISAPQLFTYTPVVASGPAKEEPPQQAVMDSEDASALARKAFVSPIALNLNKMYAQQVAQKTQDCSSKEAGNDPAERPMRSRSGSAASSLPRKQQPSSSDSGAAGALSPEPVHASLKHDVGTDSQDESNEPHVFKRAKYPDPEPAAEPDLVVKSETPALGYPIPVACQSQLTIQEPAEADDATSLAFGRCHITPQPAVEQLSQQLRVQTMQDMPSQPLGHKLQPMDCEQASLAFNQAPASSFMANLGYDQQKTTVDATYDQTGLGGFKQEGSPSVACSSESYKTSAAYIEPMTTEQLNASSLFATSQEPAVASDKTYSTQQPEQFSVEPAANIELQHNQFAGHSSLAEPQYPGQMSAGLTQPSSYSMLQELTVVEPPKVDSTPVVSGQQTPHFTAACPPAPGSQAICTDPGSLQSPVGHCGQIGLQEPQLQEALIELKKLQEEAEEGPVAMESQTSPASQQEYQPSPESQQDYQPSPTSQQEYQPSPANQQEYQPSPAGQQEYQPSPAGQHEYQPSPAGQQEYQPSSAGQQEYQPSPAGQQEYQPSPAGQQEYQPNPAGQHEYQPSPAGQHEYQPSPAGQHEYQPNPTSQQDYQHQTKLLQLLQMPEDDQAAGQTPLSQCPTPGAAYPTDPTSPQINTEQVHSPVYSPEGSKTQTAAQRHRNSFEHHQEPQSELEELKMLQEELKASDTGTVLAVLDPSPEMLQEQHKAFVHHQQCLQHQQSLQQTLHVHNLQQQGMQLQNIAQQTIQEENLPQQTIQAQNMPQQTLQAQNMPQQILQVQSMPQQTLQTQNMAQQTLQAQNMSQQTLQAQNMPQQTLQAQNMSQQTLQAQNMPQQTLQAQNMSQQTLQAQNMPQQTLQTQNMAQQTLQAHNMPQQTLQPQNMPQQILQVQSMPQQTLQTQNMPQQTLQAQNMPQQTLQTQNMPQQTLQTQNMPQQTLQAQNMPQQTLQAQNMPQQTLQAQNMPQQTLQVQNMPQQTLQAQNMPQQTLQTAGFHQTFQQPESPPQQNMPQPLPQESLQHSPIEHQQALHQHQPTQQAQAMLPSPGQLPTPAGQMPSYPQQPVSQLLSPVTGGLSDMMQPQLQTYSLPVSSTPATPTSPGSSLAGAAQPAGILQENELLQLLRLLQQQSMLPMQPSMTVTSPQPVSVQTSVAELFSVATVAGSYQQTAPTMTSAGIASQPYQQATIHHHPNPLTTTTQTTSSPVALSGQHGLMMPVKQPQLGMVQPVFVLQQNVATAHALSPGLVPSSATTSHQDVSRPAGKPLTVQELLNQISQKQQAAPVCNQPAQAAPVTFILTQAATPKMPQNSSQSLQDPVVQSDTGPTVAGLPTTPQVSMTQASLASNQNSSALPSNLPLILPRNKPADNLNSSQFVVAPVDLQSNLNTLYIVRKHDGSLQIESGSSLFGPSVSQGTSALNAGPGGYSSIVGQLQVQSDGSSAATAASSHNGNKGPAQPSLLESVLTAGSQPYSLTPTSITTSQPTDVAVASVSSMEYSGVGYCPVSAPPAPIPPSSVTPMDLGTQAAPAGWNEHRAEASGTATRAFPTLAADDVDRLLNTPSTSS